MSQRIACVGKKPHIHVETRGVRSEVVRVEQTHRNVFS